jgi:hypothetical protein
LSQGGPGVRLARHRRRKQALRRTARRIGGCDKHCDTTTMHSPTAFHTDAQRGRRVLRSHDHQRAPRKLNVPPTILPRRYAPAASVQSPYLTLSGCKQLSHGRPGVRLARHQRRRQAMRRQHGISGAGRHCEDNDA